MAFPWSTNPVEPSQPPGEISKGGRLSIGALADILNGAAIGSLYHQGSAVVTTLDMPAVPAGRHRAIQSCVFTCDNPQTLLSLAIVREGQVYYIKGWPVTSTVNEYMSVEVHGILLSPGDVLRGDDLAAAGGNYTLDVKYADVFL